MSLWDDMVDDIDNLMNINEFGVEAIFDDAQAIVVIFDNPSQPILDAETGGIMMAGPQVICKTTDVPSAKGKTLKVNYITYNIIEVQDDGTGVATLRLSKD